MANFKPGNKLWELRAVHGRPRKFKTGAALWKACVAYFQWAEDNPLKEQKAFHYQGMITKTTVTKMRALTMTGLCLHMGIDKSTWAEWRKNPDFSEVIAKAEAAIYDQKFSGAAADLLNANIIARDLGLKDSHEVTGKDGGPMEITAVDPVEAAQQYQALMEGKK